MSDRARKPSKPTPIFSEQDAALYESIVVPRYSGLFARLVLREIASGTRATVLDVGCGTGHPAFDVLRRLGPHGRVIAVDRDPTLVELARRRALDDAGRRIFFKVADAEALEFGDEVFDLVVGNLVVGQLDTPSQALGEMHRVLLKGGKLLLTRALAGTFEEILDMFLEVATRRDLPAVADRVATVAARYPSPSEVAATARAAGFDEVEVKTEACKLSFRNARELFADPLWRFVGLGEWRWIAGSEPGHESLFVEVERALDTYFGASALSVTVNAGLLIARRPMA